MQGEGKVMATRPEKLPRLPIMLLKAVPTVQRRKQSNPAEIADIKANFKVPAISAQHLKRYRENFSGLCPDQLPLSYLYFMAQRSHLATMLDERFPWPLLGMVHVANDMWWVDTPDLNAPWELEVVIQMPPRAGARKRVRPVYLTRFWQGEALKAECRSTYQVGTGQNTGRARQRKEPIPDVSDWQETAWWALGSEAGRNYARLSGDYNPIHLHAWLSRWFGFTRPIIHGMWSASRAQSDLEYALQQPLTRLQVAFRRPLVLPAEARCYYGLHSGDQAGDFTVLDPMGTQCYLTGQFAYQNCPRTAGDKL